MAITFNRQSEYRGIFPVTSSLSKDFFEIIIYNRFDYK